MNYLYAMFEAEFRNCLSSYTSPSQRDLLWNELVTAYSAKGRHYHTLNHLNHVTKELKPHQNDFQHWDTIIFAIAYHDVIYAVSENDNEEKSAALAVKRLQSFGFNQPQTEHCHRLILATKKHEAADAETNLFTDADLSILGAAQDDYVRYTHQVRAEYTIYPDLIYKPGRKKVIQHFLAMPRIFKTDPFYKQYETPARLNLQGELNQLSE
jgi:predicted metal-dependent HD superfamily phosphohydrolase